ncbi:MAG: 4Fe-4S cluster-binding domain-containing protein [Sphingobacteriales bacterium]|jgi:organic radical activating enzyme|nr:MAG: 4Fe-4S cluster-binding domain-containing protein [Sphingobacteriales bacterium]
MLNFDIEREIPVMEHFYTIQGEGYFTGTAAYFIRLAGCDVGCHWCDVKESWTVKQNQLLSYEALINAIQKTPTKLIVITGGEPLMYDINTLVSYLKKFDYQINIETSGSYSLNTKLDWICVSPKKFKNVLPEVLAQADELKCIIYNASDFDFALKNYENYKLLTDKAIKLYLQVEWSVQEKMLPQIIVFVKLHPEWNISLQTHKYLDIP